MKYIWLCLFVFAPLKSVLNAQLPQEVRSIWIKATDARDSGRYDLALVFFDQALSMVHDHAGLYNSRGKTYFDMAISGIYDTQMDSLLELAMTDYNAGLHCRGIKDTIKSEIFVNRGAVYGVQGRFKEAVLECNKGLRADPKNKNGYYNRSLAYNNLGNYKKTIADYSHYLKLDPENANIYYERGMLHRVHKRNKKAVKDLSHAIQLHPNFGIAYLERARAYAQIGNKAAAQEDYERAKQLGIKIESADMDYLNGQ